MRLELDLPLQLPVATFRTSVEQRVYVLSLGEWLDREFSPVNRQGIDWAAQCCGGYVAAMGAYGVRLDPLLKSLAKGRQRRQERKVREQIERELAELATRKKAGLQDKP